jgi:hypothetical protein
MTQVALSEEGRDVLSRTMAEIKSRIGAESIAAQGNLHNFFPIENVYLNMGLDLVSNIENKNIFQDT